MVRTRTVLTREQYQVLLGICRGMSAEETAKAFDSNLHTIKSRLRSLYALLEADNAYSAIVKAWRVGVMRTCPVCRFSRDADASVPSPFWHPEIKSMAFTKPEAPEPAELSAKDIAGVDDLDELGDSKRGATLSPRSLQLMRMMAAGYNGQQIARHLSISPNTVRTLSRRLYLAIGAHTQGEAVAWGIFRGYVTEQHVRHYREGK